MAKKDKAQAVTTQAAAKPTTLDVRVLPPAEGSGVTEPPTHAGRMRLPEGLGFGDVFPMPVKEARELARMNPDAFEIVGEEARDANT